MKAEVDLENGQDLGHDCWVLKVEYPIPTDTAFKDEKEFSYVLPYLFSSNDHALFEGYKTVCRKLGYEERDVIYRSVRSDQGEFNFDPDRVKLILEEKGRYRLIASIKAVRLRRYRGVPYSKWKLKWDTVLEDEVDE